jgi:hypothetical protein
VRDERELDVEQSRGDADSPNQVSNPLMVSASSDVLAFAGSVVPSGNRLVSVPVNGEAPRLWEEAEAHNWPRISPTGA